MNARADQHVARFGHHTPPEAGVTPDGVGDDLAAALAYVLSRCFREHASMLIDRKVIPRESESTLLFTLVPGVVLVIGVSALAHQVRALLADGAIDGWQLHRLPEPATPLYTLQSRLPPRCYNVLSRHSFISVEEVAAAPDEGLLTLRNIGPRSLAEIRLVTGRTPTLPINRPVDITTTAQRLASLEEHLQPAAAWRYGDFIDALSRSSIPTAALEKITDALNSEPVPPADPTVTLLLETAGEDHLLEFYRHTHHSVDQ